MSTLGPLRLIDGDPEGTGESPPPREPPKVFARSLIIPPGLPWEQARAANLEARHGAPLPLADLICRIKRIEPWRPGAPGRFAAAYVLKQEVGNGFETTVEVGGQPVSIVFGAPGRAQRRIDPIALMALSAGVALLVLTLSAFAALVARQDAEAVLASAEQRARALERSAERAEARRSQALVLERLSDRGAPLSKVLGDLSRVSGDRAPEAWIEAFHWDEGLIAVETRGDTPPAYAETPERILRSKSEIRPGVYLWRLDPDGDLAAARRPDSAGDPR